MMISLNNNISWT